VPERVYAVVIFEFNGQPGGAAGILGGISVLD
jgi:hypothetical protein